LVDEFGRSWLLAAHELVGEAAKGSADEGSDDVEPERGRSPETSAGPIDRIGFIEAPEIGPPNIASSPIVPPIAIAAASPTARVSVATAMITNIKKNVITSSHRNDCPCEPDGSVAPTWAMLPSEPRKIAAAVTAPTNCASQ
jgi:hypothetical protein